MNTGEGMPKVFWIYLAAAALVGAGFADFLLIAYRFEKAKIVSTDLVPVFYSMAVDCGSLIFGRLFDRFGMRLLIPLTLLSAV